ncbi:MAG: crAss001_48 related protein [Candidatus Saccharimonadaceae bacterium]
MNDFKLRLLEERLQLEEKLDKLDNFLMSEKVESIDDVQHALLSVQATAMNTYLRCLLERLERL